jgi:hypothetical protein
VTGLAKVKRRPPLESGGQVCRVHDKRTSHTGKFGGVRQAGVRMLS